MMKTLRLIGMALLAFVMSVSFIACSNDDDDYKLAGTTCDDDDYKLAGTTWKLTHIEDNSGNGEPDDWDFKTVTFNKNGTVTFNPKSSWSYARWTLKGKTLKIVLGENKADDYIEGTISINGKSAT